MYPYGFVTTGEGESHPQEGYDHATSTFDLYGTWFHKVKPATDGAESFHNKPVTAVESYIDTQVTKTRDEMTYAVARTRDFLTSHSSWQSAIAEFFADTCQYPIRGLIFDIGAEIPRINGGIWFNGQTILTDDSPAYEALFADGEQLVICEYERPTYNHIDSPDSISRSPPDVSSFHEQPHMRVVVIYDRATWDDLEALTYSKAFLTENEWNSLGTPFAHAAQPSNNAGSAPNIEPTLSKRGRQLVEDAHEATVDAVEHDWSILSTAFDAFNPSDFFYRPPDIQPIRDAAIRFARGISLNTCLYTLVDFTEEARLLSLRTRDHVRETLETCTDPVCCPLDVSILHPEKRVIASN